MNKKDQIVKQSISESNGQNACLKQSVYASVETVDGEIAFGSNKMLNDVKSCPREEQGCGTGEGYSMCKDVCNQNSHGEIDAMNVAKELGFDLEGSKLTLVGHTYCCENCTVNMLSNKVARVEILGEDGRIDVVLDLTTGTPFSVLDDDMIGKKPKKLKLSQKNTKSPKMS